MGIVHIMEGVCIGNKEGDRYELPNYRIVSTD